MALQPKEYRKQDIQRPDRASSGSAEPILSTVQEAARAPVAELKEAASLTLNLLEAIKAIKENKNAYKRLSENSGQLIVEIWCSYEQIELQQEWLSTDIREFLKELTHLLKKISSFVQDQLSRTKIRLMFTKGDVRKINEYSEDLKWARQKFEIAAKKDDQFSDKLLHQNDEDGQKVHEKKISEKQEEQPSEKMAHWNDEDDFTRSLEISAREARDREEAKRLSDEQLKKAIEISKLEYHAAASQADGQRNTMTQAHSSNMNKSSWQKGNVQKEEWRSEEPNSDEEFRSDSDHSSDSMDRREEYWQPQVGSMGTDLEVARFQGSGDHRGGGYNSHLGSPTMYTPNAYSGPNHHQYFPTYGSPFSPPMGSYGYGAGGGQTVINSGIGNVTNTNISNVGNDNSKTIYYGPRGNRRHTTGP